MMNGGDLKIVVRYVGDHPGCTEDDISAGCPSVKGLHSLLIEASEGVRLEYGFVLQQRNGLYYLGPSAYLLNDKEV